VTVNLTYNLTFKLELSNIKVNQHVLCLGHH